MPALVNKIYVSISNHADIGNRDDHIYLSHTNGYQTQTNAMLPNHHHTITYVYHNKTRFHLECCCNLSSLRVIRLRRIVHDNLLHVQGPCSLFTIAKLVKSQALKTARALIAFIFAVSSEPGRHASFLGFPIELRQTAKIPYLRQLPLLLVHYMRCIQLLVKRCVSIAGLDCTILTMTYSKLGAQGSLFLKT